MNRSGPDDVVFLGLSLSSSWGNGHATTYRALLRGLHALGRRVLFLERDVPWYTANRDLPSPDFCELAFYSSPEDLTARFASRIAAAPTVIVGSYVPDGIDIIDRLLGTATGLRVFYDIDTPITLAALTNDSCAYLTQRQIPLLDLYLSFAGGPALETLAQTYGARRPRAFYCAVDETAYKPIDTLKTWDLGYLGTFSEDRQLALDRLLLEPARRLPKYRFVVAGPQYPTDIAWPANVERIEHLAPDRHPGFYAAQRFTLNITRAAMIAAGWSPSVRLFEAAACATPVISDRWAGLTEFLPDRLAILIADSSDAVVTALTTIDPSPIGLAARDIILASHTGTSRARDLLSLTRKQAVLF